MKILFLFSDVIFIFSIKSELCFFNNILNLNTIKYFIATNNSKINELKFNGHEKIIKNNILGKPIKTQKNKNRCKNMKYIVIIIFFISTF